MQEIIKTFSNGLIEYGLPFINISVEALDITVEAGNTYEGTFVVSNSANRPMKGLLFSSHSLLSFEENHFSGEQCEIKYQFTGTNYKDGSNISGQIHIVSDCGEIHLPFDISIEAPYYETSLGKIKDLFQFTNLARMDWAEAKKVFRDDHFERIFLCNEEKFRSCYRSLRKSVSVSQAMEEFLIVINKKQRIRLKVDRANISYDVSVPGRFMDKVVLTKDHWGYAEIRVYTDASFIELDQKFVWSDRFIGNTHQISYYIDPAKLRSGNNFGRIWIKTVYQTIEVVVSCRKHLGELSQVVKNPMEEIDVLITKNYLNFRCNHIQEDVYHKSSLDYIKQIPVKNNSRLRELWNVHGAMISGQKVIAQELLEDLSQEQYLFKIGDPVEYGFFLYLKAFQENDETISYEVANQIRNIYDKEVRDWRLLWCLLYVDKRYENNSSRRLADIKEQFELGCRSPILYFEALCDYLEEPMLLRDLSGFEIQVLNFGIKHRLLTTNLILQYSYLANKKKYFHLLIYQGLQKIYQSYPSTEVLTSLCCMLIKGYKKEAKYFYWYQLAVEAQLRITELYEYYMYTVDESRKELLPQSVLLYFIYNSNLNDRKKAFLYANIVRNREKIDSIYRTYIKRIEVFTQKQLETHHINRNLVILYQHSIDLKDVKEEIAIHLPFIMYKHEIICMNSNMVSVNVIHKEFGIEETQPIIEGRAEVDIFTSNADIFFLDEKGNKYRISVAYEKQPYMSFKQYEGYCLNYSQHPMLLLQVYDRFQSHGTLEDEGIQLRKRLLEIEELNHGMVYRCILDLVNYYYENYDEEQLDYFLSFLDIAKINHERRGQYIELMIVRSYYDGVMVALEQFGFEGIKINRLIKLCSFKSKLHLNERIPVLVSLCYYVFQQGKYDENTLRYLALHYHGATQSLYHVWAAAKGFDLETKNLEERLLTQMLFAQCYVQDSFLVFQEYYKNNTNDTLVKAYLNYYGYRYIVHDRVLQEEFFLMLRRELNYEYNEIWLIAWLKYQSSKKELTESDLEFVDYHLTKLIQKGIIFPFYQDYHKKVHLPDKVRNTHYIEYKTDPNKKVFIHYRILKPNATDAYVTEQLPNIFMGIHVRGFLLFYREVLQYYITEEYQEEVTITESFHIRCNKEPMESEESKYNQINLMLMARELHDEQTLLTMMEQYVALDYKIKNCFEAII